MSVYRTIGPLVFGHRVNFVKKNLIGASINKQDSKILKSVAASD